MKRVWLSLGLLGTGVIFSLMRPLWAVDIVPASMQDIVTALGPDAKGLRISQETLPDLFALTASRIEENPKQFVVEQPYLDGRWKGGKAVIEYARDLSYTLVSVYDKSGHRQRIYSVNTNFTEHLAHPQAQAQASTPAPSEAEPEAETSSEPSVQAARPAGNAESNGGFEWDESKGTYVSVSAVPDVESVPAPETKTASAQSAAASASHSPRHRRRHAGDTTGAGAQASSGVLPAGPAGAEPSPVGDSGIWIPSKTKTSSTATQVKVANTTWVEKTEEAPAAEKPHHKHRHAKTSTASAAASSSASPSAAPVVASTNKTTSENDEWVPKSIQEPSSSPASSAEPPPQPAPPKEEKHSHKRHAKAAAAPAPTAAAPTAVAAQVPDLTVVPTPTPATSAAVPPAAPAVTKAAPPAAAQNAVPSTEELLANPEAGSGPSGPDTSEGDKWVPKPTPKPKPEPVPEAASPPMQVAMIPKQAPVDNSVDNLLKIAGQEKSGMPRESDTWVPTKTEAPKPDADINKELALVREQEKAQAAPKPAVKVRRDVNNPEEGVLPVSTFEKFSGPMYGRHREYERRFFPGKKPKANVGDHDFYVEEVDRKKEIHNVYFYRHQKGKAPKLVAVERHERVSFLGNYDIEKEDKGKISTYN